MNNILSYFSGGVGLAVTMTGILMELGNKTSFVVFADDVTF